MALALERNQLGVKFTGRSVSVPNHPKAKLMYYLGSIATVLELTDLPQELINYSNYHALNDKLARLLLELCKLMSPDLLNGKCIFQVDDLDGRTSNQFVELSAAKMTMVATSSVMMAGRKVEVAKIMFYKPVWRRTNYDEPIVALERSLPSRRALTSSRSRRRCIMM